MDTPLDIDAYLDRIRYKGPLARDGQTLIRLHQAHTLTIPFENLDVYYRRPISLDPADLFTKIVTCGRGGYCFEMNGLFREVLECLGFCVTPLLARVAIDFQREFGPRTHQVLMVTLDGSPWLADVGFGKDGLISPLRLDTRELQTQFSRAYRLTPHPQWGYILDLVTPARARCQYAFTLDPCTRADTLMSNHYTSTFPLSLFLNHLICTMPTVQGRITLTETHLKTEKNGTILQTPIKDEADFQIKLAQIFGLDLEQIKGYDGPRSTP